MKLVKMFKISTKDVIKIELA